MEITSQPIQAKALLGLLNSFPTGAELKARLVTYRKFLPSALAQGRISRPLGISLANANAVIAARKALPAGKFTDVSQVKQLPGMSASVIKDLTAATDSGKVAVPFVSGMSFFRGQEMYFRFEGLPVLQEKPLEPGFARYVFNVVNVRHERVFSGYVVDRDFQFIPTSPTHATALIKLHVPGSSVGGRFIFEFVSTEYHHPANESPRLNPETVVQKLVTPLGDAFVTTKPLELDLGAEELLSVRFAQYDYIPATGRNVVAVLSGEVNRNIKDIPFSQLRVFDADFLRPRLEKLQQGNDRQAFFFTDLRWVGFENTRLPDIVGITEKNQGEPFNKLRPTLTILNGLTGDPRLFEKTYDRRGGNNKVSAVEMGADQQIIIPGADPNKAPDTGPILVTRAQNYSTNEYLTFLPQYSFFIDDGCGKNERRVVNGYVYVFGKYGTEGNKQLEVHRILVPDTSTNNQAGETIQRAMAAVGFVEPNKPKQLAVIAKALVFVIDLLRETSPAMVRYLQLTDPYTTSCARNTNEGSTCTDANVSIDQAIAFAKEASGLSDARNPATTTFSDKKTADIPPDTSMLSCQDLKNRQSFPAALKGDFGVAGRRYGQFRLMDILSPKNENSGNPANMVIAAHSLPGGDAMYTTYPPLNCGYGPRGHLKSLWKFKKNGKPDPKRKTSGSETYCYRYFVDADKKPLENNPCADDPCTTRANNNAAFLAANPGLDLLDAPPTLGEEGSGAMNAVMASITMDPSGFAVMRQRYQFANGSFLVGGTPPSGITDLNFGEAVVVVSEVPNYNKKCQLNNPTPIPTRAPVLHLLAASNGATIAKMEGVIGLHVTYDPWSGEQIMFAWVAPKPKEGTDPKDKERFREYANYRLAVFSFSNPKKPEMIFEFPEDQEPFLLPMDLTDPEDYFESTGVSNPNLAYVMPRVTVMELDGEAFEQPRFRSITAIQPQTACQGWLTAKKGSRDNLSLSFYTTQPTKSAQDNTPYDKVPPLRALFTDLSLGAGTKVVRITNKAAISIPPDPSRSIGYVREFTTEASVFALHTRRKEGNTLLENKLSLAKIIQEQVGGKYVFQNGILAD